MPLRVYVDWNDQTEDGLLCLHIPGSAADLLKARDDLHEGMRVILYQDPDDPDLAYEMDGILERDGLMQIWMARPIEGTVRELPKRPDVAASG